MVSASVSSLVSQWPSEKENRFSLQTIEKRPNLLFALVELHPDLLPLGGRTKAPSRPQGGRRLQFDLVLLLLLRLVVLRLNRLLLFLLPLLHTLAQTLKSPDSANGKKL